MVTKASMSDLTALKRLRFRHLACRHMVHALAIETEGRGCEGNTRLKRTLKNTQLLSWPHLEIV